MPFITLGEIFDIVVMTLAVGFIFKDVFSRQTTYAYSEGYDPLSRRQFYGFNWHELLFACLITAPGIIFHELAHKFAAIAIGISATFHAAYTWLGIGIVLKMLNFGFIFFVPGYVTHSGAINPLQSAIISFAGPFLNLVLWLGAWGVLELKFRLTTKQKSVLILTKQINMFLFIFNMLPIPPFDGWYFFSSLWKMLL